MVDLEGLSSTSDLRSCPQVDQIHSAFSTIGFVFVKNHGIRGQNVSKLVTLLACVRCATVLLPALYSEAE